MVIFNQDFKIITHVKMVDNNINNQNRKNQVSDYVFNTSNARSSTTRGSNMCKDSKITKTFQGKRTKFLSFRLS